MTASNQPFSSTAPTSLSSNDGVRSRWVLFNRALAASETVTRRPGLQGRWKPSDRVVIASGA